jgi:hypothetical protein
MAQLATGLEFGEVVACGVPNVDPEGEIRHVVGPEYLSQALDGPSRPKRVAFCAPPDACDYTTGIDKKRELHSRWQRAYKLILAKEDVLTVSRSLELALFMMRS